jgi:hypothetical protein
MHSKKRPSYHKLPNHEKQPTVALCFKALDAIIELFPNDRADAILVAYVVQRCGGYTTEIIAEAKAGASDAHPSKP